MRRRAGLHRPFAGRQLREEPQHRAPPELANDDHFAPRIDGVNLQDVLGQIDANPRDSFQNLDRLAHGRLPSDAVSTTTILARLMPSRRRPPHHRNTRRGSRWYVSSYAWLLARRRLRNNAISEAAHKYESQRKAPDKAPPARDGQAAAPLSKRSPRFYK
jgi:hypothetical protein